MQSLDEIYEMLIENDKYTDKRFHPSAGIVWAIVLLMDYKIKLI